MKCQFKNSFTGKPLVKDCPLCSKAVSEQVRRIIHKFYALEAEIPLTAGDKARKYMRKTIEELEKLK